MAAAVRFNRARVGGAVVALVSALAGPGSLHAATFTVINTNDGGLGSLRQAILDANGNAGADTVNFAGGVTGTITLTTGELLITDDLTIAGPGAGVLTVNGNATSRVFDINAGVTVAISGLTIANGGFVCCGSGILNAGTLTVSNTTLSGNQADAGGAIFNDLGGTVTVANSTLSGNQASEVGGAIYNVGTLTVTNSVVSGNMTLAINAAGGGIFQTDAGTLTVTNSTFSGNTSYFGGGILSEGTLTVSNSTFSTNHANTDGGGLYNNSGTLTVNTSTFSANTTGCCGGGIYNNSGLVTVSNSTFSANSVDFDGGGINNFGSGTLGVTNSTFSGNAAGNFGGGIRNDLGTLRVSASTFSGNGATFGGGGLYNDGTLSIKNSLVADSSAGANCVNAGAFTALGVNFDDDGACPGFAMSAAIHLGPLANNGGPTQTHALLPGSVALDAVLDCTDVLGSPVTTDQRGVARPQGPRCDAGAFEVAPSNPIPPRLATLFTGAGPGGGPHVKVFGPGSLAPVASFFAYAAEFHGGVYVAGGDLNGDGVPDIVTGAGPGGSPQVKVFDGGSGVEIRSFLAYDAGFRGGVRVAVGDVNGDGVPDIVTGPGPGGGPQVRVFDGRTGALIRSFFAYPAAFAGGVFVAAGDVNGDGMADIITGAGEGGGPNVRVFSGATGLMLANFFAYDPSFTGGVRVAAGDMGGAGRADFIITGPGPGAAPVVKVFDPTGGLTRAFFAYAPAFTGGVFVAAGDVNGDGTADIVTGAGAGGGPQVKVFDGGTLGLLANLFAYVPAFLGGVTVGASP